MANIDIKSYIDQLRQYLPYVPLVPVEAISATASQARSRRNSEAHSQYDERKRASRIALDG
jgi:hypothetical protein